MNEPEWIDANPETADLPNKGRTAIMCIAGGLALAILTLISLRIRTISLAAGGFALMTGIGMLTRMRMRKQKPNYKFAAIVTAAGFLMLLASPRFGVIAGFAGYILITGAIGLVVLGLWKAIKLSWDLGRRP